MKRELPKNVRQIGNVSDSSKIYVEDYVDTYLNQLCEKADQALIGAFLIGEIVQAGEEDFIYVYGAVQMKEIGQKGKEISVSEAAWKEACETSKKYFGSAEILGWFLTTTGLGLESNYNLMKVHQKLFSREKSLLVLKEAREKEEKYYVHKFHNLMEVGGHYIYYEKNNEMQDYMIATRKANGITPSEVIEDTAIKSFRSMIRDKMEKKEKKENSRTIYAVCTALVLVVLVIGVTTLNDYGRMSVFREKLEANEEETEEVPVVNFVENINTETEEPETEVPVEEPAVEPVVEPVEEPEVVEEVAEQTPYSDGVYVVEKGDTLAIISRKVYGDLNHIEAIRSMNGLKDGNLILVGQKLLLP